MTPIGTFGAARCKVQADIEAFLNTVKSISSRPAPTVEAGIAVLHDLRKEVYEDLNQIQHEQMILCAAEHLIEHGVVPADTAWSWNPRQTGNSSEPDLQGCDATGAVLVSCEITTSTKPAGTIEERMVNTLRKMLAMPGRKFYFVRTDVMLQRALSKLAKLDSPEVTVVRLPDSCFGIDPAG